MLHSIGDGVLIADRGRGCGVAGEGHEFGEGCAGDGGVGESGVAKVVEVEGGAAGESAGFVPAVSGPFDLAILRSCGVPGGRLAVERLRGEVIAGLGGEEEPFVSGLGVGREVVAKVVDEVGRDGYVADPGLGLGRPDDAAWTAAAQV